VRRLKGALTVVCAGLALALSACGGDGGSGGGPAALRPPVDPADQLEWGEHAVRIGGISAADIAAGALMAAYPPGGEARPNAWFFVRTDRWTDAVLAAQFATKPINAGVLAIEKEYLPTATVDTLNRVKANGFPKAKGLRAIVMGKAGVDVFLGLKERKLKTTLLKEKTPFALGQKLVPFHGGGAARYSTSIVVASAEQRDYTLPAAAWSAYSGDALALVKRDEVPAATREVIAQREKLTLERPTMYVIGPEKVISEAVVEGLSAYGTVKRIAGDSAVETAVALAKYRDPKTQFGWGFERAPANVSLVNASDWGNAIGAFTLAARGPQAPLLLTDSAEAVPEPVLRYLRDISGSQASQGFVFGDRQSIGSQAFRQFDRALGTR
jgi:hypothetical protein